MKAKEKLPKIYNVNSVVKEYSDCKEVPFNWFVIDRKKPLIPYEKAIRGYKKESLYQYPEGAIDESFTRQEAEQLVAYLEKEHKDATLKTNIEEQELPIENNISGFSAIPVGGLTDFYALYKEKNYNLPFKVEGYFNLRYSKTLRKREEIKELKKLEELKELKELEKLSIKELEDKISKAKNKIEILQRVIKAKLLIDSYEKEKSLQVIYDFIQEEETPF